MPALVVLGFVLVGGALSGIGGGLSEVQRNDSAAYLPEGAEATRALADSKRFTGTETTTAVVVYVRPSGITRADQIRIISVTGEISDALDTRLAGHPIGPIVSDDGQAAQVIYRFVGSEPRQLGEEVRWLRQYAPGRTGLAVHVAGPAAVLTDLTDVFGEVNGVLLAVTGAVVLLILVLVYRSPILPFVVLASAGVALGMANGILYLLARAGVLTVSGDAQGILDVLVLGAGTDYALLLTSRFREELRRRQDRYEAMRVAWLAVRTPILASGGTVIFALLCLLASGLPATRGLGPVAAIGIGCALLAMLVLLPAALVLLGRFAFWPFRPVPPVPDPARAGGAVTAGSVSGASGGLWGRVARGVGGQPRLVWVLVVLALGGLALGMTRLEAHGVPRTESFLAPVDSNAGQDVLTRHFPEAAGTPAVVIANADRLDEVLGAVRAVPGVTRAVAYVDPLAAYENRRAGRPPPEPKVVDGLARLEATLDAPADSTAARQLIRDLRAAVRAVPGADARVGGYTAATLDVQETAQRDRVLIIPLVLAVVFVILALLLRAVVAPLLLTATVILSFLATLGVSGVVFHDLIGFAGADSSFPLFAFVFLVALGIDYNIFLMTRVREEVAVRGHRAGTLAGLTLTGGVITSAGIVLAATFAALAVLPLVVLVELAFAVAFGVLLDTFLVRSLLVPALTVDIGRTVWWPGPLRHSEP
ncbi:MAG TPA: MMPL family transporter [Pilimelia sp.]|nr:MMPL family transporter [Pilimelia sp.]